MKSLIIETSTESALLAVLENGRLLWEKHLLGGPALSKSLGLEIKKILELIPPPFDQIILGSGPGSYTGIRVGAAMAQALSFGWKIPLYTVSSLTAFAPLHSRKFHTSQTPKTRRCGNNPTILSNCRIPSSGKTSTKNAYIN